MGGRRNTGLTESSDLKPSCSPGLTARERASYESLTVTVSLGFTLKLDAKAGLLVTWAGDDTPGPQSGTQT